MVEMGFKPTAEIKLLKFLMIGFLGQVLIFFFLTKTDASGDARFGRHPLNTEMKYTKEQYYELLMYMKENNLIALDPCPEYCFDDDLCLDLCESDAWP